MQPTESCNLHIRTRLQHQHSSKGPGKNFCSIWSMPSTVHVTMRPWYWAFMKSSWLNILPLFIATTRMLGLSWSTILPSSGSFRSCCVWCRVLPVIHFPQYFIYAVRGHRVAENSVLTLKHGHNIGYILQSHALQSSIFAHITLALLYIGMIGGMCYTSNLGVLCKILYFGWLEWMTWVYIHACIHMYIHTYIHTRIHTVHHCWPLFRVNTPNGH